MTDWLVHTLAWTAALIALVLVLRRPVARFFGPQAAYALWLLPMLRLHHAIIHATRHRVPDGSWKDPGIALGRERHQVSASQDSNKYNV